MRGRRQERGAVAIVIALITTAVIIPIAGLAVDLGMQRVARLDMQSLADVVALDLSRQLDGVTTTGQWANRAPSLQALADQSRARNGTTLGAPPVVTPTLGTISESGTFTALDAASDSTVVPTAVRVVADTSVGFGFMRGRGSVSRSAIGVADSSACFKLGSYAAAVKSNDSSLLSPLNNIFGLSLSLLSYQGMANADVTLAQLAANPRIGSANALLTGDLAVTSLVKATIDVLTSEGSGSAAAVSALNTVLTVTSGLPTIKLSKLLSVSPSDQAALNTQFNVLDLIAGAVLVADGQHAIAIPNLWAGVAGTGHTADASLYVQQGASTACGAPNSASAVAHNSQVNGYVKFDQMNSPSINLGFAKFKTDKAVGRLDVNLASAQGQLISPPDVHCGANTPADPTTFSVDVSSDLASVALSIQMPVSGDVSIAGIGLLGAIGVVDLNLLVDVNVTSVKPAGSTMANLRIPPNDTTGISSGSPVRLSSATVSVTIDPASSVTLLGVPISLANPLLASTLNGVIGAVITTFVPKTVTPLVANINDLLTGPIADLLGVDVGGADVFGIGATCAAPRLAG